MQKKIRNAQLQKVPFMVIAGDRDIEEGAVSFRYRSGAQDNGVPSGDAASRHPCGPCSTKPPLRRCSPAD